MSCDVVTFPPSPPRPPKPLPGAVEDAIRSIRLVRADLAQLPQRGRVRSACELIGIAADELERAIDAHSEAATRELREIVLTALGPNLKYGDVIAGCRALEMVLRCLDLPDPPADAGGAA